MRETGSRSSSLGGRKTAEDGDRSYDEYALVVRDDRDILGAGVLVALCVTLNRHLLSRSSSRDRLHGGAGGHDASTHHP